VRLDQRIIDRTADHQSGVVTSRQLIDLGGDRAWLSRQVTSGRWQRLHRGVLLTHSGPVSWDSRATAALLYAGKHASLSHDAAAYLHGMTRRAPDTIDVTIPADRRVTPGDGLVLHHRSHLPVMTGRPLRTALPDTALDLVARAESDDDALGWLCEAVRAGATPGQLRRRLATRPRLRNSALIRELLAEVAAGVESPLEGRYHRDVERAHGLPTSELQVRQVLGGTWIRADRIYRGFGLRVELDGRLAHPGGRTDKDTWRDNLALLHAAELTLRYRWYHARITPCATTGQVLLGLRRREPDLPAHPCTKPSCTVR